MPQYAMPSVFDYQFNSRPIPFESNRQRVDIEFHVELGEAWNEPQISSNSKIINIFLRKR